MNMSLGAPGILRPLAPAFAKGPRFRERLGQSLKEVSPCPPGNLPHPCATGAAILSMFRGPMPGREKHSPYVGPKRDASLNDA